MTAEPVIEARGVVRRFGKLTAVGGVDLDVRSESERQYEQESYDPKSGRRIPSQDPDKVRTWELE